MTYQDYVSKLKDLAKGSHNDFLDEFADIHDQWHKDPRVDPNARPFEGTPIGFLSFHKVVIKLDFLPG
jgi:hypothetical protein